MQPETKKYKLYCLKIIWGSDSCGGGGITLLVCFHGNPARQRGSLTKQNIPSSQTSALTLFDIALFSRAAGSASETVAQSKKKVQL
jgi:hypothetical protein